MTTVRAGGAEGHGTAILSGVDTLVRLLLLRQRLDERDGLATATMVSGYPGSPLGGFDLALEGLGGDILAAHRIVHRPGLNEELAAAIVWGSQMGAVIPYDGVDGVAGAWYGKGPGLDLCGDALKHANAMGAGPGGGAVMFCGDDPAAKSSTLTCDSQYTFEDACVPLLYPGDQQDVLDLGVHAFRMSRYAGPWVGLKIVTAVADGIGTVDLDLGRHSPRDPDGVTIDGHPWRHKPLATIGPHAVPDQEILVADRRLRAAKAYARRNGLNRVTGAAPGARLGVVCAGKTYADVMEALASLSASASLGADASLGVSPGPGIGPDASDAVLAAAGVRILKLGMTYPLVEETVLEFAATVGEILVIEEKRPFVETQLRAILHEAGSRVPVLGKRDSSGQVLVSPAGELDSGAVAEVLTRVLPALAPRAVATGIALKPLWPRTTLPLVQPHASASAAAGTGKGTASPQPRGLRTALPLVEPPGRPPGFCSGCPHNRSTVIPDGALVGGGVGCHGIMYFEARHAGMKSLPPPPMGAEGVPWLGLSPFVAEPHVIQNLGDGTLSHSGTLAIRASVAAGADITFKILYNATVAMTGGQDVTGLMDVPALTRALEAEGVAKIVVCAEEPKGYPRKARWAAGARVLGRDRLPGVQEELRHVPGVTVIIYDQRCSAQARRLRKRGLLPERPRRVLINEVVCEGCGDCTVKSNCLSVLPVSTEFGEKRQIHDPSCNSDYTCLEGDCPSFVTITPKRRRKRRTRLGATDRQEATAAAGATATTEAKAGGDAKAGAGAGPGSAARARPALPAGALPVPAIPAAGRRYGIYFTGIGGTGVVTANRIIAAAAESAGFVIGGMDQTGLSQKAGAVVSHLHLAGSRSDLGSGTVGAEGADLYLSSDILQAAAARHLAKVRPGHTIVVVDPEVTPTSVMLQSDGVAPGAESMRQVIADRAGNDLVARDQADSGETGTGTAGVGRTAFVAAKHIAESVFSDHMLANVILLGAAFQLGGLPVSLDDIGRALRRQGKAATANRDAFEWGRWAVHDSAAVAAAITGSGELAETSAGPFDPSPGALAVAADLLAGRNLPTGLSQELSDLLARRCAQAADYQDVRLAKRFLDLVARAAARDDATRGWALTRAVAESWFKLLTYKDEYEVARLHLAADYDRAARALGIDGPYSVKYHLQPRILPRLGMHKKLPLGRPYALMFRVLRPMRRLRGTPFDVLGWDPERRMERALIAEYEGLIRETAAAGVPYETSVLIAESAQAVKGYAGVKKAAVSAWRVRVAELREHAQDTVGSAT